MELDLKAGGDLSPGWHRLTVQGRATDLYSRAVDTGGQRGTGRRLGSRGRAASVAPALHLRRNACVARGSLVHGCNR